MASATCAAAIAELTQVTFARKDGYSESRSGELKGFRAGPDSPPRKVSTYEPAHRAVGEECVLADFLPANGVILDVAAVKHLRAVEQHRPLRRASLPHPAVRFDAKRVCAPALNAPVHAPVRIAGVVNDLKAARARAALEDRGKQIVSPVGAAPLEPQARAVIRVGVPVQVLPEPIVNEEDCALGVRTEARVGVVEGQVVVFW